MKKDSDNLSVGGYLFYTEKDAQIARTEIQKIEYLEARIDYSAPDTIRYIYEKAIHERLFKTPVGLGYLTQLREFLLSQPGVDPKSIIDIPLYIAYDGGVRERTEPARRRVAPPKERDFEKGRFIVSVIINVLLALAMLSMFYISYSSDQPNVINYERALIDKYAYWEQELTDREQLIRDREKELQMSQ
ncbi:MAG: hypothetical protein HFH82_16950 [Lachnospiraceae bacterium]|nr:hypothetical protein [Lachnospiraceae bacterium]